MTRQPDHRYDHAGVVLVGAGAVNLVTALRLAELGVPLLVMDAGPDPRGAGGGEPGCTLSGCDARIVSLNESRHHFLSPSLDEECTQFDRTIADGGWLGVPPADLRDSDHEWIERFRQVPTHTYRELNDVLVACNRRGLERWNDLADRLPALFRGITTDGLLRIYLTPESHEAGRRGERAIGALIDELSPAHVDAELGAMAEYRSADYLGVLRVRGFGINVHEFVRRAVSHLEAAGARFLWRTEVAEVSLTDGGELTGVVTGDGLRVTGTHVVVSPGVPRPGTLRGMPGRELLAGVAGGWLTLPDDGVRLGAPLKVARSGFASDQSSAGANVIPGRAPDGRPVIHLSSGHAYVGADRPTTDPAWTVDLARVLHETAEQLFPRQYRAGVAQGVVVPGRLGRVCVRPWTPSCHGLFDDSVEGPGGRLLVTGGHNTGGFAQAPVVADAVAEWFTGRSTTIRDTYFPPARVTAGAR
ncbi:NAD(P)/FAD-dependent oxidoreductase [Cellulomonas fimi]|uniref:FAD dependent oxidoreductase n=1 Tax=Cellulomonas fimi (strain ATCC 484 / DSM 20113 / JCM 1341 / CCUG 24087 / LMG 16345 / NBRC 15513 / NCIMB 8980 / NCTC 7547 / NRS-133) TaxID=590998 RepID=F4H3Z5_CELFA|nr:FAD-dependent oxidoreductase [Cellulomonas fimi]AEE44219.1 FAD dependent oxidoreductase [Cellulomonas fimi ATCC 484]NNH05667.1 FAD-dependent oxidoreductase [Cellulomonas fimi]VEH25907.1 FAD dependent oxidoreductase [Cellulomonas fimi]